MFNILQAKKTDDLKVFWCNGLQEKRNTEYSHLRLTYYLSTRSSVEEITNVYFCLEFRGARNFKDLEAQLFRGKTATF